MCENVPFIREGLDNMYMYSRRKEYVDFFCVHFCLTFGYESKFVNTLLYLGRLTSSILSVCVCGIANNPGNKKSDYE